MAETGSKARTVARTGHTRSAIPRIPARLVSLAAVTVLFVFGLFCIWQAWVMAGEEPVRAQVRSNQRQLATRLEHVLVAQRARITRALADPALKVALAGGDAAARAAAAARTRALLPHMLDIDFYSPTLDEVLDANYPTFGHAKASELMQLQSGAINGAAAAPVVVVRRQRAYALALAQPVFDSRATLLAYVWLAWPDDDLTRAVQAAPAGGGRLALHVGSDAHALVLTSHGSADVASDGGPGMQLAGSDLWVAAAMPRAPVFLPGHWLVAVLLAALSLAICGAWAWQRYRASHAFAKVENKEPALSHSQKPAAPAAAPRKPAPRPSAPATPRVVVDPAIFRAYDIRGVVGTQLTSAVAHALGQAIGSVMGEQNLKEIVVGRDGRLSGQELTGALADGLRAAGIDVIDVGAVPTPLIYFATHHFRTGSGVAVTGSHNPPDYNGFKVMVGGRTLSEDAIADLGRRMAKGDLPRNGQGTYRQTDIVEDYIERVASDVQAEHPLKVVVDAGNGIAGEVAPRVLEAIGCEVIPLFCDVDGTFPNHHPDPSDPKNLEDLQQAVAACNADLGVAFDGDGDRLGVVTHEGEIVFPDRVLMLFARDVLARNPGATIIYDVKCTGHLGPEVLAAGGSPLMWRTGHSLIKAKMIETKAALAGEMSGHFFFRERWYGFDDGIYSATRLLEILASDVEGRTPDQIFATLPKGVSTPELKIAMAEGENHAFVARFQEHASFEGARLTTIDGVRADWPDGWGLVRASNTTPSLVLRFDAADAAALARIEGVFRDQLLAFEPSLKLTF